MTDQIEEVKDKIIKVLKKHGVKRGGLFGSIVRGELTDKSDIGILVELSERKSLLDLVRIERGLSVALNIKGEMKVIYG